MKKTIESLSCFVLISLLLIELAVVCNAQGPPPPPAKDYFPRSGRISLPRITFSHHVAMESENAYEKIATSFLESFHVVEKAPSAGNVR